MKTVAIVICTVLMMLFSPTLCLCQESSIEYSVNDQPTLKFKHNGGEFQYKYNLDGFEQVYGQDALGMYIDYSRIPGLGTWLLVGCNLDTLIFWDFNDNGKIEIDPSVIDGYKPAGAKGLIMRSWRAEALSNEATQKFKLAMDMVVPLLKTARKEWVIQYEIRKRKGNER